MINIGSSTDAFYRYKRNIIDIKYINTKGVQTKLCNLDTIVEQLRCNIDDLIKYLKSGLSTSIKNNIIRGKVEKERIELLINKFIDEYVLCPTCKLPELNKKECMACGYSEKKHSLKEDYSLAVDILNGKEENDNNEYSPLDREINQTMYVLYDYINLFNMMIDYKILLRDDYKKISDEIIIIKSSLKNMYANTIYNKVCYGQSDKLYNCKMLVLLDTYLSNCWKCDKQLKWSLLKVEINRTLGVLKTNYPLSGDCLNNMQLKQLANNFKHL